MTARAAGAGRQTICRRWPGKAGLVLEAFAAHARFEVDDPAEAQSWEQAVIRFLEMTFIALELTDPALRSLMAHAQHDPGSRQLLLDRFIEARHDSLRHLLRQGIERGELPADAASEVAVFAPYGAAWYRLLPGEAPDRVHAQQLATLVLSGLRSRWLSFDAGLGLPGVIGLAARPVPVLPSWPRRPGRMRK